MKDFELRPLRDEDRSEYADLVHAAFNAWYWKKGWGGDYFRCAPEHAGVFYDIYNDLTPGCSVAAVNRQTGRLMGACFYHPREHHVSLGIMSVHPSYFGRGVGRALVNHIVDYTQREGYDALRLVGSAINMDSFSLYNRSGFVPRQVYHDMVIAVPKDGMKKTTPGLERVRPATADDVAAIGALEMAVSGIRRDQDYRYAIDNPRGVLEATVIDTPQGELGGFMVSVKHPALNMLGPCVARTEADTAALILDALDRFRGETVLLVVPMDKRALVETLYGWHARNVETHLFQVRGRFKPFEGVNLPSFLPETG